MRPTTFQGSQDGKDGGIRREGTPARPAARANVRSRLAGVTPLWIAAAIVALALFAASCGGAGDSTTTTGAGETPTTTPTTAPAPSPLADGEHFGFVRDLGQGTLVLDPALFLTGEPATAAAREDGLIGETEDLPNDFYIDNDDTDVVDLTIAEDAEITLLGFDASNVPTDLVVTWAELVDLWDGVETSDHLYGFVVENLPVHLVVSDGVVTTVTLQYLP